jgi:hypothetical protein
MWKAIIAVSIGHSRSTALESTRFCVQLKVANDLRLK